MQVRTLRSCTEWNVGSVSATYRHKPNQNSSMKKESWKIITKHFLGAIFIHLLNSFRTIEKYQLLKKNRREGHNVGSENFLSTLPYFYLPSETLVLLGKFQKCYKSTLLWYYVLFIYNNFITMNYKAFVMWFVLSKYSFIT